MRLQMRVRPRRGHLRPSARWRGPYLAPAERHGGFELVPEDVEHPGDTFLSRHGKRKEHWPAKEHRARACTDESTDRE